MTISFDDFLKVQIRKGTVVKAEPFPEARKPALKVWVDFGDELGVKKTSAQITRHYDSVSLVGKSVAGCVNLGERQIGRFLSEFLLLGFEDEDGGVSLISPDHNVPNGTVLS
ncbi:MAG: tRNA-binding protein [Alphaproteobacteria bacterium]|nr:tRNA-binding protein [Alphaproteobacteria bacterium]NCQ67586.1 tRNA-binding protein [Alphaproteobacteria bacterium]NCT08358.1 tRNA-binding protein [Alphaproteobacteria bacterium]